MRLLREDRRPASPAAPYLLMLFSLFFIGIGIFMCVSIVNAQLKFKDMQSWVKTAAKLTHVEQTVFNNDDGNATLGIKVDYEYNFEGKKYHSSRIGSREGSDNQSDYQEKYGFLNDCFKKNASINCFVNPKDPQKAVLFVEINQTLIGIFTICMIAFLGCGILTMISGWNLRKKKRECISRVYEI